VTLVLAALVTVGMTACAREATSARRTVEEYRLNAVLRRETFATCLNDLGTLGASADCLNAREAERLEAQGSLRDHPPLGLRAQRPL
jgi:hypothetical protein